MTKITLIGAGSVVFAKNLIGDILQHPALENVHIALMDIDARRLKVAKTVADKIASQLKVPATISATLDLEEACRGAKYAVTTIQVGGYRPSTVVDFEIPKKYGLKQTIADTLGVGGVFRSLRTIPPLINVAKTLQNVGAADPLLLNYSNPMAMNMWAIDRATGIDSVGLCHSVQGTSRQISKHCGLDYDDVTYKVAGINHMAFFLDFKYRGQDAYPLLFKALEDPKTFSMNKVRFEMMRRLGYFVTQSSEHQAEYNPYFIHHGDEMIEKFDIPIDEYIRRCESIIATWEKTEARMVNPNAKVEIKKSLEYGSEIINSCETGELSVIYGNVPNTRLITNLPEGCCVEVPCLVDKQGIQPTHIGDLPPQLAAICQTNINVQALTVEAALTGKREHIYHAVMSDPHTAATLTLDQIWKMCDEMIEQHQKDGVLGEFSPTRHNTGRSVDSLKRVVAKIESRKAIDLADHDSVELVLVAENETQAPFDSEIQIMTCTGYSIENEGKMRLSLGIDERIEIPLKVQRTSGNEDGLEVWIEHNRIDCVCIALRVPHRQRIELNELNKEAKIEVLFSSDVVATGLAKPTQSGWTFQFRVSDTDIQVDKERPWKGSLLKILVASEDETDKFGKQILVLPDPENPVIRDREYNDLTGKIDLELDVDKGGYDIRLDIPQSLLPVEKGQPLLLDIVTIVTALGDAHGKTQSSWQNSGGLSAGIDHFAIVIPEAIPSNA
ncbi:MAG: alpha-glucosidase/alpha-galactosidase [Opitutales bacterium]|nr:alpha-glucosidase/alpha-galactosidase [Opitutales bacterium]